MYVTRSEIEAELPAREVLRALIDDKNVGEEPGLFDQIGKNACDDVDGILGQRFAVPFAPSRVPPIVKRASRLLVLSKLYQRRGVEFPQAKQLEEILDKLSRIASGAEPLAPEIVSPKQSVSFITEPSRVVGTQGGVL